MGDPKVLQSESFAGAVNKTVACYFINIGKVI